MSVDIYRGDLQACRVCLATDIKLISLQDHHLKYIYSEFSAVPIMATDNLPQHICTYCCALLKKSSKFKQKCKDTYTLLSGHLLEMHALTTSYIDTLDKSHLGIPLQTVDTLQFSCIPDECSTPKYTAKNKMQTDTISVKEPADLECFDSNNHDDASGDSKDSVFDEEPCKHIKEETEPEVDNKKQNPRTRSNTAKNTPTDTNDEKRIEDFKYKYCDKIENSDKKIFYMSILEKYLRKDKTKKSNELTSEYTTEIPAFKSTDKGNIEDKKCIEICNSTLNTNQNKFYEYIRTKYGNGNSSDVQKKVTDLGQMKLKNKTARKVNAKVKPRVKANVKPIVKRQVKRKGNNLIEFKIAKISKEYNFDVVLLLKEEITQDFLARKETKRYKRAKYRCEVCYMGFATETTFQNHMTIHDPSSGPHECQICHVRFKESRLLSKHTGIQHRYKFLCQQCGHMVRSSAAAREHHGFHSGFKYECEHCKKTFYKYSSRINHIRIHHGSVSCEICHMKFAGEAGLLNHKTKAHRELFKCLSCSVQFHNENALRRHRRVAAAGCGPNIRPCTLCGDSLSDAEALKNHILEKHAVEKQMLKGDAQVRPQRGGRKDGAPVTFMCEVCAEEFKFESVFLAHQRKHTGERPAVCDYCNKGFRDKFQLRAHLVTHTDERRFRCSRCAKAFRQVGHLTAHLKTHSNEKPYSCEACEKLFKYSNSLKEHERTVHEGLPPRKRLRK